MFSTLDGFAYVFAPLLSESLADIGKIAAFAAMLQKRAIAPLGAFEQLSPQGRIWAIASQEVTTEVTYPSNAASNALASCKSAVSNPSVNQLYTGASRS